MKSRIVLPSAVTDNMTFGEMMFLAGCGDIWNLETIRKRPQAPYDYEPPAIPDAQFPQQADYSPKPSPKPMPTNMRTVGPGEYVHRSCPDCTTCCSVEYLIGLLALGVVFLAGLLWRLV